MDNICKDCGKPILPPISTIDEVHDYINSNQDIITAQGITTCPTTPPPFGRHSRGTPCDCCNCCPPSCCDALDVSLYCWEPCCPCPTASCGAVSGSLMFPDAYSQILVRCVANTITPTLSTFTDGEGNMHVTLVGPNIGDRSFLGGNTLSSGVDCFTCGTGGAATMTYSTEFTCIRTTATSIGAADNCCYTLTKNQDLPTGISGVKSACVYQMDISISGTIFNGYAGEAQYNSSGSSPSYLVSPIGQAGPTYSIGKHAQCMGGGNFMTSGLVTACNPEAGTYGTNTVAGVEACVSKHQCDLKSFSASYSFQICGVPPNIAFSSSIKCCPDVSNRAYRLASCCPGKCFASCECCEKGVDMDNPPMPCGAATGAKKCWYNCPCCSTPCDGNFWSTPLSWLVAFNGSAPPYNTVFPCVATTANPQLNPCGSIPNVLAKNGSGACGWESDKINYPDPWIGGTCDGTSVQIIISDNNGKCTYTAKLFLFGDGTRFAQWTSSPLTKPTGCGGTDLHFDTVLGNRGGLCKFENISSVNISPINTNSGCKPTCCDNSYFMATIEMSPIKDDASSSGCDPCCAWEKAHGKVPGGAFVTECGCPAIPGQYLTTAVGLSENFIEKFLVPRTGLKFENKFGNTNFMFQIKPPMSEKMPRQYKLNLYGIKNNECESCEKYNSEWILDFYKNNWIKKIDLCKLGEMIKLAEFNDYFYLSVGQEDSGALYSTPASDWLFDSNNQMTLDVESEYCYDFPDLVTLEPVNMNDLIPYKVEKKKVSSEFLKNQHNELKKLNEQLNSNKTFTYKVGEERKSIRKKLF